jgi:hypothetical protein
MWISYSEFCDAVKRGELRTNRYFVVATKSNELVMAVASCGADVTSCTALLRSSMDSARSSSPPIELDADGNPIEIKPDEIECMARRDDFLSVGRTQNASAWNIRFNDIWSWNARIVEAPVIDHSPYYIVHPNQFERFANQALSPGRVLSAINALSNTNDNAPS